MWRIWSICRRAAEWVKRVGLAIARAADEVLDLLDAVDRRAEYREGGFKD